MNRHGSSLLWSSIALLLFGSCSEGPTEPSAPPPPVSLFPGMTFDGTLSGDAAREFVLTSIEGNRLRVMFQARSGSSGDSLILEIRADSLGPVIGTLSSIGTQVDLAERVFHLPMTADAHRYFVRARPAAGGDGGPFRIVVLAHDTGVEHGPAALVLGETVAYEEFDSLWDVDRFTFTGDSGVEYVFALQPLATNPYSVALSVSDALGNVLAGTDDPWTVGEIERNAVRLRIPGNGGYSVRLGQSIATGAAIARPVADGRYRFWSKRVDPRPESRPAAFVLGDTILDALDHVGDVDIYEFEALAGELLRLDVSFTRAQVRPMLVTVTGAVDGPSNAPFATPPSRVDGSGATFVMASGASQRVIVRGGSRGPRDSITTPYRLELRRVSLAPESRAATLSGIDTVVTEGIERAGDVDRFDVSLAAREVVDLNIVSGADREGSTAVRAFAPNGDQLWDHFLMQGATTTYRSITAWDPGVYRLEFRGTGSAIGSYRLEMSRIDRAPEVIARSLPIGTWVEGEPLAPAADEDDFEFAMLDGREYNIFIDSGAGSTGSVCATLEEPSWLVYACTDYHGATGRFRGGPGGTGRFRVTSTSLVPLTGTYALRVALLDSLPESLPATGHAFGDTLNGERVEPAGDSDEFMFTGTEGQVIRTILSSSEGRTDQLWNVVVYRLSDGLTVGGGTHSLSDPFTLPSTGDYRVVISIAEDTEPIRGAGGYRLVTVLVP
jgi:hypothetical protein